MKRAFFTKLFPAILTLTPVSSSPVAEKTDPSAAVVDLGYAQYQGIHLAESGVNEFLGMRYARPPTGDLRWREPQDPENQRREGVLPATSFGPLCIGVGQTDYTTYSEDCLYINVFAPANATSRSKLPVWFFIQGGGYAMNGNGDINGTQVVANSGHNIVFVNINYRVGALGFLASEKVRADGVLNAGLLDQRKALKWVQKYIHLFGGNPAHVVIHGDSAGGGSVAYHLTAYGGRDDGLFVGAMPESPFFPTSRTVAESEFQFTLFANSTGCLSSSSSNASASVMSCLRSLPLPTIQSANVNSPFPGATGYPNFYFLPVIDGSFSPAHMYSLFSTGRFVHVPVLVGGDTNEGDFFVPNASTQAEVDTFLVANFPHLTPTNLEAIHAAYPPMPRDLHAPYYGQASALYGNSTFMCGGLVVSKAADRWVGGKSWNYLYDITPPWAAGQGWGAVHTAELGDIFGLWGGPLLPWINRYYMSFVRALDPNTYKHPDAPVFPTFGREAKRLVFRDPGNASFVEPVPEDQSRGCKLWISLASVTEQ